MFHIFMRCISHICLKKQNRNSVESKCPPKQTNKKRKISSQQVGAGWTAQIYIYRKPGIRSTSATLKSKLLRPGLSCTSSTQEKSLYSTLSKEKTNDLQKSKGSNQCKTEKTYLTEEIDSVDYHPTPSAVLRVSPKAHRTLSHVISMTALPKTCDSKDPLFEPDQGSSLMPLGWSTTHQRFDFCDLLKTLKAWELGAHWPVRAEEDCFIRGRQNVSKSRKKS